MNLQVNLKLKLTKINKVIKVEYNTFQKATFDEYLITSLVLRGETKQAICDYIDDITGDGSLNAHFKKLYEKIKGFGVEQLQKIMRSSMFPILKKDSSNVYTYYPQIDVSVYKNKLFKGDLINYDNLVQKILLINEEVIKLSVDEKNPVDKPDSYEIVINEDGGIKLVLCRDLIEIKSNLFEEIIIKDIDNISQYKGKIHKKAEGTGWHILNKSAFENLISNYNYFYLNDEDHYAIRENDVRKTEMAELSGLYIYRDTYIPFGQNTEISETVLKFLIDKKSLGSLKPKSIVALLRNVKQEFAVEVVNSPVGNKNITKEIAEFAVELLKKGILAEWNIKTLNILMSYCDTSAYTFIYRANNSVDFTTEQLLSVDTELLTEKDRKKVEKYYKDIEEMKQTITTIVGIVTTSGLRQAVKKLNADADTKRFTKLCNSRIGHEENKLDNASYDEVVQWHKEALELKSLAEIIEKKLSGSGVAKTGDGNVSKILISDIGLSVKTFNSLKRAGILTLAEISEKTEKELLKIRNLGKSSVDEIKEKLKEHRLSLK